MFNRRAAVALAAAVLAIAGLAACGDDDDDGGGGAAATTTQAAEGEATPAAGKIDPSKPEVHVSLIALKIPGSDLLTPYTVGAQAAADRVNAEGGIGGRKVVVDSCNSQGQAQAVATCARRMVGDDPVALVGCDVNLGAAAMPVFKGKDIPGFYCLNTDADLHDPMAFSIEGSGAGQQVAMARWLCEQADIKRVVNQMVDLPQVRLYKNDVDPILKGCGKETKYVYVPITAADFTPYLNQITAFKPDWVMAFPLSGPQAVQFYKAFEQAGIPADKTSTMSSVMDIDTMLEPAGTAIDGARMMLPVANLQDETNADVQAYLQAMEGKEMGAVNNNVAVGYMYVAYIAAAAKEIGYDKFDPKTLADFTNTNSGFHVPLSRELINPGPEKTPQIKQPFMQMVQWKDGKLNTITEGTEDGWLNGQ